MDERKKIYHRFIHSNVKASMFLLAFLPRKRGFPQIFQQSRAKFWIVAVKS